MDYKQYEELFPDNFFEVESKTKEFKDFLPKEEKKEDNKYVKNKYGNT